MSNSKTLYCVFVEGVYRHQCVGVFSTLDNAIEAADGVTHMMEDDYHRLSVIPFTLDAAYALLRTTPGGRFVYDHEEPHPVYEVRKGQAGVRINSWKEYFDLRKSPRGRTCHDDHTQVRDYVQLIDIYLSAAAFAVS